MNLPNSAELWELVADSYADYTLQTLVTIDAWRSKCSADLHVIRSKISLLPTRFNAATCLAIGRKLNTNA